MELNKIFQVVKKVPFDGQQIENTDHLSLVCII